MRAHIPFHTFRFGNRPLDSSCGTTVLGVSWCGWVGFWSSFWLSKLQQQRWLLAPETSTIARDAVVSWDFSWFYRVQSAFLPETFYNFQYDPRRISNAYGVFFDVRALLALLVALHTLSEVFPGWPDRLRLGWLGQLHGFSIAVRRVRQKKANEDGLGNVKQFSNLYFSILFLLENEKDWTGIISGKWFGCLIFLQCLSFEKDEMLPNRHVEDTWAEAKSTVLEQFQKSRSGVPGII